MYKFSVPSWKYNNEPKGDVKPEDRDVKRFCMQMLIEIADMFTKLCTYIYKNESHEIKDNMIISFLNLDPFVKLNQNKMITLHFHEYIGFMIYMYLKQSIW